MAHRTGDIAMTKRMKNYELSVIFQPVIDWFASVVGSFF